MCGKCVDKPFHLILAHFRGPLDYRSSGPVSIGGWKTIQKGFPPAGAGSRTLKWLPNHQRDARYGDCSTAYANGNASEA